MYLFQDLCESEKEKLNPQLLIWFSVKIDSLTLQVILGAGEILTCALKLLFHRSRRPTQTTAMG